MSDEYAQVLEQQRRAFELQFGSLESMGFDDKTKEITKEPKDEETTNDMNPNKYSDVEDEDDCCQKPAAALPKVIKFQDPSSTHKPLSKEEKKQLRSGKPLRKVVPSTSHRDSNTGSDSDEEKENIKNDAELQRFLHESHLLSNLDASSAESTDQVHGKARARTLELHLQNLSKTNGRAPRKLEKLPMQVRKGMIQKHLHRINTHEKEAKEAGIVLSKTKKGQFRKIETTYKNDLERRIGTSIKSKDKQRRTHRQRGLKIQSVGKSTRQGLKLSAKDISRINKS